MRVRFQKGKLEKFIGDLLIVNLFSGVKKVGGGTGAVNQALGGRIEKMIKEENFEGKEGEILIISPEGRMRVKKIILLGLGPQEKFNSEIVRRVTAVSVKKARELKSKRVGTILHGAGIGGINPEIASQALTEGALLGSYTFVKYKTGERRREAFFPKELVIIEADERKIEAIKKGINKGEIYAQATIYARDLVNEPASEIYPKTLVDFALALRDEKGGIEVQIFEKKKMEELKMGGILGVANGSDHSPYFVHLLYQPKLREGEINSRKIKKIVLVGKSITFDSGGLALKPALEMGNMKMDMAGGAAVLGVFYALRKLKPLVEVHGLLPICENMPSGRALKPGDIIRTMSGKTVEVLNPDAEGRLTLADALTYAEKLKPDYIVDLATLTGACIVALGEEVAGMMGNNRFLLDMIEQAASRSGEKIWELPLVEEYKPFHYKSLVADLTNVTSPKIGGGTITAGLFLQEFVKKTAWVHLDIAGPAWEEKEIIPYLPKGGTGFGVRTILEFIQAIQNIS
jgi:leucyl aminopeptidase